MRGRDAQMGPFVVMNCATLAIPGGLKKNCLAWRQAVRCLPYHPRRAGMLERAHTGTLLLDEVSDMPLETQGKIVRALQDQTFERLGGSGEGKGRCARTLLPPIKRFAD